MRRPILTDEILEQAAKKRPFGYYEPDDKGLRNEGTGLGYAAPSHHNRKSFSDKDAYLKETDDWVEDDFDLSDYDDRYETGHYDTAVSQKIDRQIAFNRKLNKWLFIVGLAAVLLILAIIYL